MAKTQAQKKEETLQTVEEAKEMNEMPVVEQTTKRDVFNTLSAINVNEHTEKKNGLTYLSWAWAWAEVKKRFPEANYVIYERDTEYGPVNYFTDGNTCWVKTGVIIEGLEHIEELPVMDFKNKSIPYNAVTSTDVNKAIQRSLTKTCARHGLGLYIYAGEDLPEESEEVKEMASSLVIQAQQEIERIKSEGKLTTPEQKREFVEKHVIPFVGSSNYKACRDVDKLRNLVADLKAA